MAKGKSSNIFVWIILVLLIIGLAGFGASGLNGTIRTVGKVGDEPITVNNYVNEVQSELRALQAQTGQPITFEQAEQFGLTQSVLGRLVSQAAVDHEARVMGLSVGDAEVRNQLMQIPAFQGVNGQFDREAYAFTLNRSGLNEAEFEESLRDDSARTLLQSGMAGAVRLPASYGQALANYYGERRNFTWAQLTEDNLTRAVPTPTQAEIQSTYDDNPDAFTAPAAKAITYTLLTPDMILDTIEISDDALQVLYDERRAEFVRPERRLVERLVFGSEEDAQAAKARLDSGAISFSELVAERGLTLADIDLGDVVEGELDAASDAIFALEAPGVVGPLPSTLGPALFRMNAILAAQETTFEEARDDLGTELALDRARRQIEVMAQEIDDMLAGGATLEDVANDTEMTLNQMNFSEDSLEATAAYEAFRAAAEAVTADDFPEVIALEDGGIAALRLDEVVPPTLQPLADVRGEVIALWRERMVNRMLREQANEIAESLSEVGDLAASGLTATIETDITRQDFIEGLPRSFIDAVFEMEPGARSVIDAGARVFLVRLDAIAPPDPDAENGAVLNNALTRQLEDGLGRDILGAFAADVQSRAGIEIDQRALDAVNASFGAGGHSGM
ncbi:MAG: SurA N-terminal domain-containing protein [Pseudomonadota bacterium]